MSQSSPERNKALVISFYEQALNDRNLSVVADFLAPYYRQHNPTIEDGVEGLRTSLDSGDSSLCPEQNLKGLCGRRFRHPARAILLSFSWYGKCRARQRYH
jgi:hypothetical protein